LIWKPKGLDWQFKVESDGNFKRAKRRRRHQAASGYAKPEAAAHRQTILHHNARFRDKEVSKKASKGAQNGTSCTAWTT